MRLLGRAPALGVVGVLLAACAAPAVGAPPSDAQARSRAERAACMSGDPREDRTACLREAGAAFQEENRDGLSGADEARYEQNRLARCDSQPPQDRDDCVRRMRGEGTTSGSVQEGGIYRELVRPVIEPRSR